jgi:hypothetical protein
MDFWSLFLTMLWFFVGIWLILGETPLMNHVKIDIIFGIENRWGKILIGTAFLLLVAKQCHDWYIDPSDFQHKLLWWHYY